MIKAIEVLQRELGFLQMVKAENKPRVDESKILEIQKAIEILEKI